MAATLLCDTIKNPASSTPNIQLDSSGNVNIGAGLTLNGSISGTTTIAPPAVAGTTVATLPSHSGTVALQGPAFSATILSNFPLTSGVQNTVIFDTVNFDTDSSYSTGTGRFQPNVAGYYQINACAHTYYNSGFSTNSVPYLTIVKNATNFYAISQVLVQSGYGGLTTVGPSGSVVVYLNGTTDYVNVVMFVGGESNVSLQPDYATTFNGIFLRGA